MTIKVYRDIRNTNGKIVSYVHELTVESWSAYNALVTLIHGRAQWNRPSYSWRISE